jgi:hypothetical protein
LRFTFPFVDHIAHRVRLVGHQIELSPQNLATGMAAHGAVYYQILEPERAGRVLDDVDAVVEREALSSLLALATEPVRTEAAALSMRLKAELNARLAEIGLRVTRCQLQFGAIA